VRLGERKGRVDPGGSEASCTKQAHKTLEGCAGWFEFLDRPKIDQPKAFQAAPEKSMPRNRASLTRSP
jgi:hypothetical protein